MTTHINKLQIIQSATLTINLGWVRNSPISAIEIEPMMWNQQKPSTRIFKIFTLIQSIAVARYYYQKTSDSYYITSNLSSSMDADPVALNAALVCCMQLE